MKTIAQFIDVDTKQEIQDIIYKIAKLDYHEDYDECRGIIFKKLVRRSENHFIATIDCWSERNGSEYEVHIIENEYSTTFRIIIEKPEKSDGEDNFFIREIANIILKY